MKLPTCIFLSSAIGLIGSIAAPAHAQTCDPVKFTYMTLPVDVELQCRTKPVDGNGNPAPEVVDPPFYTDTDVSIAYNNYGEAVISFDAPSTFEGRTAAWMYMDVENSATVTQIPPATGSEINTYFWNSRIEVGNPISARGIGDDVCPQTTGISKKNIGYGTFTPTNRTVKIKAYLGNSQCGANPAIGDHKGKMTIKSGAHMSVWTEDPDQACEGDTIRFSSYYDRAQTDGATQTVNNSWWQWPPSSEPIHKESVTTDPSDTGLIVVSAAEGTPWDNPNTVCGSETATLTSQIRVAGSAQATSTQVIPASGGQGHLVIGHYTATALNPGTHDVELHLGRNYGGLTDPTTDPTKITTTGGCCGDASIAIIKY